MAELSTSALGRGLRWINGLGRLGAARRMGPHPARTITGTVNPTPPPTPPRRPARAATGLGLPGHRSPGAGFEAPFEMLSACHERVQRSLDLLARLIARAQAHGVAADVRQAAADVARYFSQAAPQHHEDEERHVLPRLAADARPEVRAAVQQILDDHAAFRAIWADLGPALAAVRDGADGDWPRIARLAEAFIARHAAHLPLEDGLLFPAAAAGLDAGTLRSMGQEMARRRQGG